MAVLVDTCVLGRLANIDDPNYQMAIVTLADLRRQGEVLYLTAQNLIEFHNFATRPIISNGLGMDFSLARTIAGSFESTFTFLEETPEIYPAWRSLVDTLGITGKQVHDARLVAVCHVYGVTHILTFNVGHFRRLAVASPGLTVIKPGHPHSHLGSH